MERFEFIEADFSIPVRVIIPRERVVILVSVQEWDSLKARAESCRASFHLWAVAYSVFFAMGVTAGLSIVPLMLAQPPGWALTAHITICALGIAVGLALVIAERTLVRRQHNDIDRLIGDMERIKDSFMESGG